jgi:hypothetical protein
MGVSLQRTNSAQRVSLERGRVPGQRHSTDLGARLPRPSVFGNSRLSLEQSACASCILYTFVLTDMRPVTLKLQVQYNPTQQYSCNHAQTTSALTSHGIPAYSD